MKWMKYKSTYIFLTFSIRNEGSWYMQWHKLCNPIRCIGLLITVSSLVLLPMNFHCLCIICISNQHFTEQQKLSLDTASFFHQKVCMLDEETQQKPFHLKTDIARLQNAIDLFNPDYNGRKYSYHNTKPLSNIWLTRTHSALPFNTYKFHSSRQESKQNGYNQLSHLTTATYWQCPAHVRALPAHSPAKFLCVFL